jgi:hypothetical protein
MADYEILSEVPQAHNGEPTLTVSYMKDGVPGVCVFEHPENATGQSPRAFLESELDNGRTPTHVSYNTEPNFWITREEG